MIVPHRSIALRLSPLEWGLLIFSIALGIIIEA